MNRETIMSQCLITLIMEMLKLARNGRIYPRLDVVGPATVVWVKEGEEEQLAVETRYCNGQGQPLVILVISNVSLEHKCSMLVSSIQDNPTQHKARVEAATKT